jgi:hypothetical protein
MYNNQKKSQGKKEKPTRKLYATIIQVDAEKRMGLNMIPFLVRTGMMVMLENRN